MACFDLLGPLKLTVDGYRLKPLISETTSGFTRESTVVELHGGGCVGFGEDVTYENIDQQRFVNELAPLPLAGSYSLLEFSELVGGLNLFVGSPERTPSLDYRRWAFESAALDLALKQAGISLGQLLKIDSSPVRFVCSIRLGEPPSTEPILQRLERVPDLKFKLDPTSSWDQPLFEELAKLGCVDSVDLKGLYSGSVVDQGADPLLYQRVVEFFPDAWIEDPVLDQSTGELLGGAHDRITWDANIHSVADVDALPFKPLCLNCKPSRFGSVKRLLDFYDYCSEQGIKLYGGGQFELGIGRRQNQYLASLFYPDAANDLAPVEFNRTVLPQQLPTSPLQPPTITEGI